MNHLLRTTKERLFSKFIQESLSAHEVPLRSGHSNIETSLLAEEANLLLFVAPDETDNHRILLSPLHSVYCPYFNRSQRPKEGCKEGNLCLIPTLGEVPKRDTGFERNLRRYDSDLVRSYPAFKLHLTCQ